MILENLALPQMDTGRQIDSVNFFPAKAKRWLSSRATHTVTIKV